MKPKVLANALKDAELTMDILHLCAKYGLVNEIALRNSIIRKEYHEAKLNGERIQDFMIRMGKKYFCSPKTISTILYDSGNRKKRSQIACTERS